VGSSQTDTNGKVVVSLLNKHDYVLPNSSSPNHFSFTSHSFRSLLDLTTVSNTIASNCSTTVTNIFFGSDHYIIHTTVNRVELTDTQFLSKWNFAKANRPKFADMCENFTLLFSKPRTLISTLRNMCPWSIQRVHSANQTVYKNIGTMVEPRMRTGDEKTETRIYQCWGSFVNPNTN